MIYETIPPSPALRHIVRFYWILESDQGYTHHAMADMCPELLFHYNGRFHELLKNGGREDSFISGFHGQSTRVRKFHIDRGFGMLGVYLYPQAVPMLFGIPATELTDQMPDLHSLLKHRGRQLEEEIFLAQDNAQRIRLLENFFLEQLSATDHEQPPVFNAIAHIIRTRGMHRIAAIAAEHFISERQFERQIKRYTGFTPKMFSRIARFHGAISRYGEIRASLTDIALECGYYDQSHFIHEFRKFSGHHPGVFFSGRSGATEWME